MSRSIVGWFSIIEEKMYRNVTFEELMIGREWAAIALEQGLFFFLKERFLERVLPASFLNSSSISSLSLDLGIFPINSLVLGSLTFTFNVFPSPIS